MSRNGSGTYTLPSGNPVVSGTLIESSWANTTLSDLASAMTDSLSRSGQGGMTAALRLYDGTSTVPGLAWGSETTTGWYRAGAGDMRLVVTGSEVMKYLASGVSITGTLAVTGQTLTLENSTAYYPQVINRNKTDDANGSYISLQKIRSSSIVQNGDVLGNVIFSGYDGAAYLQGAYMNAVVSATPGTNDMPTDLAFGTTPDGGAGPTECFRLTRAGNAGFGTATPSQKVDVVGSIKWSGATYENVFTITDGASVDLNPANGTIQLWTLGANRSPTATNFAAGQSMTLMVNDGTARTITWPSVTWVGGSAPTLATSGYTVIELWEVGTTLYGALVGSVA